MPGQKERDAWAFSCSGEKALQHMGKTEYNIIDEKILKELPRRIPHSNKGTYGKVLCIAGSVNMAGAAYLCGCAAYRAGAGLVRILTPEENRVILQTLLPEAVLTTYARENPDWEMVMEAMDWSDAIALGPGLGQEPCAAELVRLAMSSWSGPLVIDADGINLLGREKELLRRSEAKVILTPHVGEFARFTGQPVKKAAEDVPGEALAFAKEYGRICVLKDAPTAVGLPDGRCFVNSTGNNGMSTGGSGDVLTGVIAGLLGQGLSLEKAALLGVWLHGRAGDLAAGREGAYGLMARHLIEFLPKAMKEERDE